MGITDPNPLVCGKGIDILLEHGVEVEIGLMADKIREQNRIFLKYITERRPWVTLKAAMTLDGKIATEAGDSRWVTSPRSRVFVHRLRGGHSGICVGAGTVRADNPMLDCRLSEFKNPVRILPDSLASLSPESRIAQSARDIRTIVMHTDAADPAKLEQLHACGVETLACKDDNGRIDLSDMLERLGALGIDSLLVEGGQELSGSFVDQGLVDEYYFFIAPKILGGRDALSPVGGNGFTKMADARGVNIDSIRHFGPDFLLHGYPEKK